MDDLTLSELDDYEKLKVKCIRDYGKFYKDELCFDYNKVSKKDRVKLLQDEDYIKETKKKRSELFATQLSVLDDVIKGRYAGEKETNMSSIVLKAVDMQRQLLFGDVVQENDESKALNVTFLDMSREDLENDEKIELNVGDENATLGSDFGMVADNESFEGRLKAQIQEKLKQQESTEE